MFRPGAARLVYSKHKDDDVRDAQNADTEYIVQEDTRQKEGQARQFLGFILRFEMRTRKLYGRVSRHRDWLAGP